MSNQKTILNKIDLIKKHLIELEKLVKYDTSGTYVIKAGWTFFQMAAGLVDPQGRYYESAIPARGEDSPYVELDEAYKFRLYCKGILHALKMIPVTELEKYLSEDGPQIQLHCFDTGPFENVPESCEELAAQMKEHVINYRLQTVDMTKQEFNELLGA